MIGLGLGLSVTVSAAPPDRAVQVTDLTGKRVHPLEKSDKKATVLFFVIHDCPIANRYVPEMIRLHAAYAPKKVQFYLVYADPDLSAAEAKKHSADFGYTFPALLDPTCQLAKKAGATVSPEAAIFAPDGKMVYRGRIDDRYVDFGKMRDRPDKRNVRLVLDALLAGKPVTPTTTKAIGCFLPVPK